MSDADIQIKSKEEVEGAWRFLVDVDGTSFKVELEKDYWRNLTGEGTTPERLVQNSFRFLLDREPKSSILREFNLKVINKYFSEYEDVILKDYV